MQLQLPLLSESEIHGIDTARVFENESAMRERAPALFATNPHPKMSTRYSFTNTYEIVKRIHAKGFHVSSVQGGTKPYSAVMVRMRSKQHDRRDRVPELVLLDSHDGTKRLKAMLGLFEFICMNGMVVGDTFYSKSFIHIAPDLMEQVILELADIGEHIERLSKRVETMRMHKTNIAERIALADEAIRVRFGGERPPSFITAMRQHVLETRRAADQSNDLYTVMNVIQENVLRGGMMYDAGRTIRRVASISNVNRNVAINQRLWTVAEELVAKAA